MNVKSLIIHDVKDFEIELDRDQYEEIKRQILPVMEEEIVQARGYYKQYWVKEIDAHWLTKMKLEIATEALKRIADTVHPQVMQDYRIAQEALKNLGEEGG